MITLKVSVGIKRINTTSNPDTSVQSVNFGRLPYHPSLWSQLSISSRYLPDMVAKKTERCGCSQNESSAQCKRWGEG